MKTKSECDNASWYDKLLNRLMISYDQIYLRLNFFVLQGPFNFNLDMTFKNV